MNKTAFLACCLFIALSCLYPSASSAINWESDLAKAFEKAKAESRPIMADFYTDWCGWCKKLDKDVYTDADINRISEKFICVKVNCELDRGAVAKYGLRGFPTIIFFNSEGNIIETVIGYKNAKVFNNIMNKVAGGMPGPVRAPQAPPVEESVAEPVMMRGEADAVYLKNGREIKGIISNETPSSVKLNIGGGNVVISRSEIKSIYRAKPNELSEFKSSLEEKQASLRSQEKAMADAREKRFKAYGDWTREDAQRKDNAKRGAGEVKIMRDTATRAVLVDAILNDGIKTLLTIDTGADVIVLSKRIGDKLGINMSADQGNDIKELHLAGGKTVKARMVVLKTVKIQDIEENNVLAAVLLEDSGYADFRDGLLGRSFLGRFNINIDLENMNMKLQRLK